MVVGGIAGILLVVAIITLGRILNFEDFDLLIAKHFVDYRGPAVYFISICLFYSFYKIKIGFHPLINKLAKTTLGVYLIHDNELLREIIWNQWFHIEQWFEKSNWYIIYLPCAAIMVFLICIIIELMRDFIVRRCSTTRIKTIQRICKKVDEWYIVK